MKDPKEVANNSADSLPESADSRPSDECRCSDVPMLAVRCDGKMLLSTVDLKDVDLARREVWVGLVLISTVYLFRQGVTTVAIEPREGIPKALETLGPAQGRLRIVLMLVSRARDVGGSALLGSRDGAVSFQGPPRQQYLSIARRTIATFNAGATLLDLGVTEARAEQLADEASTVGAFLLKLNQEARRNRSERIAARHGDGHRP